MNAFRPEHENWMLMSGLIAMCVLVAIAVVILPLFGPRVAGTSALLSVLAIAIVCYFVCVPRASGAPRRITRTR